MNLRKVTRAMTRLRENFIEFCVREELPYDITDLECACGVCSYMVFVTLRNMGYRPTFHMNDNHCFVTCDKYWIDLTLTQFDLSVEQVYIHDYPYLRTRSGIVPHQKQDSATTERELRRMFAEWPEDQNPFKQRLPKLQATA
jgi:hypothetical protein